MTVSEPKTIAANCPKCGNPLVEIRYPSDSMLNRDQWESQLPGDLFCTCHNNNRGNKPYAYFWKSEFVERAEPSRGAPDARCAVCGWPSAGTLGKGCKPGNCSVRPLPTIAYDTDRANREYTVFWGERSSRRWEVPAISEIEKLRAGHVVLLEALRKLAVRSRSAWGRCMSPCDCVVCVAEAVIERTERP